MELEGLWRLLSELQAMDEDGRVQSDAFRSFTQRLRDCATEARGVELLFLDAHATYMIAAPNRAAGDEVPRGGEMRRADPLLTAILELDPAHTGAAMMLGYVRYDQGRWAESQQLFDRADPNELDGEHPARRIEMMACCD